MLPVSAEGQDRVHDRGVVTSLGLSEYTDRFVENGIDVSVLPDLTDQDLKDLDVLLGHRRKMLRAIRDLGGASVAATSPSAPVRTEPNQRGEAERHGLNVRHVSSDVRITRISEQYDGSCDPTFAARPC